MILIVRLESYKLPTTGAKVFSPGAALQLIQTGTPQDRSASQSMCLQLVSL